MRFTTAPLTALALSSIVLASSGDRSSDFQYCVSQCQLRDCSAWAPNYALRWAQWTCIDDCKYFCMHTLTDTAIASEAPVQQYYGKWPFWRLLGMQEPASVAFSLLNLWFHLQGARAVRKRIPNSHPMKMYYLAWAMISVNAWTWSAVFHTRDLPITEKLDYFSAALAILFALYYTVIRLFHLYPVSERSRLISPSTSSQGNTAHFIWTTLCTLGYIVHVTYLSVLPRFDYAYNIVFNLVLGLTHNLLWLFYSLPSSIFVFRRFPFGPKSYRPQFADRAALSVALTTAATALELFDFPPWKRIIDAHALWHLSTVPIVPLWYNFLICDALDEGWKAPKT